MDDIIRGIKDVLAPGPEIGDFPSFESQYNGQTNKLVRDAQQVLRQLIIINEQQQSKPAPQPPNTSK